MSGGSYHDSRAPFPEDARVNRANSYGYYNNGMRFKSIPREEIPPRIGDMEITPALLEDYKDHEILLKFRARHSEGCRKAFDAMRLCILGAFDEAKCERIHKAYEPCADEMQQWRLRKHIEKEDERRKMLAARSRALEATGSSTGSGSGVPPTAAATAGVAAAGSGVTSATAGGGGGGSGGLR